MTLYDIIKRRLSPEFSLSEKQTLIFLILIILLSSFLRIYQLDNESIWLDEGHSINRAQPDIYNIMNYLGDIHPPLYFIVLHSWIGLFGDSEFSTRFLSVIFGIISIYIIYKVGRELFNKEVGIISSFILSISLFHISHSQEIRQYSLILLLILMSNFYFIKILKKKELKSTIGYIISTSLLIYIHMLDLFFIIPQIIYYILIFRHSKVDIKYWIMVQFTIFISFLPWIYILSRMPRETFELVNWLPIPTLNDLFETFISFSNESLIIFSIFVILVFICMLGIKNQMFIYIDYRHKKETSYLLLWLLLPIISIFIISLVVQPLYKPRYLIGSLPALYILASNGIYKIKRQGIILLIIIIIIIMSMGSILKYYSANQNDCGAALCGRIGGGAEEQWRELVNYINKSEGNNDVILLYPAFIKDPFEYYYNKTEKRSAIKLIYTGEGTKWINWKSDNKTVIWLVYYNFLWSSQMKNDSMQIMDELNKTYDMRYEYNQFKGITLYKFLSKNY